MRALSLAWIPLVASAISVVLSVASIYISTRQPEVLMLLPDVVRVAGGHASGASYVYLQPAFVSTGANERIEVIEDMSLALEPVDGTAPATTLRWKEQVSLVDDNGTVSYRYQADAIPLLVGPRSAANPIALFEAPAGWFVEAGTYDATLTANRVVGTGSAGRAVPDHDRARGPRCPRRRTRAVPEVSRHRARGARSERASARRQDRVQPHRVGTR